MATQLSVDTAESFVAARRSATALTRYPGTMPESLDSAYAIQNRAIDLQGGSIAGWKVGRIGQPLAGTLGTDRLAGPIFADAVLSADGNPAGKIFADGFGAAEAEFLFRIGTPPPAVKAEYSLDEAAALIDAVHVGLEIASSPFAGINEHGPLVTISDFGNNNGLIVGAAIPDWRTSGLEDWSIRLLIDGEEAGTGKASAFNHGPLGSVRFLLENLAARDIAVPAGTWVSTGAVTGVHQVRPGQQIEAVFGDNYTISCTIAAAKA